MLLPAPLYSEDFIGRREELAFLREEFRSACERGPRFVTIEGEAGIGKSRLLAELLNASGRSAAVCGTCLERIQSPYLPLTEVLEQIEGRRSRLPSAGKKWEFFNAVAAALARHAGRGPAIVAIEDLQWADGGTLELLTFLMSRLADAPVLFVLTMRADARAAGSAFTAFRSAASRARCSSVALRPLRRNDVRNLVQQMLRRHRLALNSETISQIETLAEGNPLFAEELVRVAMENGELTLQRRMPLSLAALLDERLEAFDQAERDLLIRAAILGEVFDVTLLSGITGVAAETLLPFIQRCVERDLLLEERAAPLRFRFKHGLIRKALADRLVVALAAPLHVQIATAIEPLAGDTVQPAELAYHWSAARNAEKARYWNERAAEHAWSVYAYRDAIRFYSEALRWDYPPGASRARLYEHLGTLHYIDGSADEPARFFDLCRNEYGCANDRRGAARALLMLADQRWVDARTTQALTSAQEVVASARTLDDAELEKSALLSVARFSSTLGMPEQALRYLSDLDEQFDGTDAGALSSLNEIRGEALAALGQTQASLAYLCGAAQLAMKTGSPELIAQVENNVALCACDLGELQLAVEHHRHALEEAGRTAMTWRAAYCSLGFARTLMLAGDLEAARTLVWSALETGVTTATFKTKAAAVGIPIALMRNDLAMLEVCAREETLDLAHRSGEAQRIASVSAAFAELRAEQGAKGEAQSLIARALRVLGRAHRAWDLLVVAARFGADADVAIARALRDDAAGRPRVRRAYRLLFDAFACTAQPRRSRLAAIAGREFQAMGDVLHGAQCLELAGERDAAAAAYRRMGSVRDAQRLQADAPGRAVDLTPRQAEIARQVALGRTNRQIASELTISEHTVEHHVSAIFERLGLRSRAQLVRVMARAQTE